MQDIKYLLLEILATKPLSKVVVQQMQEYLFRDMLMSSEK